MNKKAKIIRRIREKLLAGEYEFADPHFSQEMLNDSLIFADIETAIANGKINDILTDDLRGIRYEVVGTVTDGRQISVICRIKENGKLLFITTWEIYE